MDKLNINLKDDYIRYLERKCCELIMSSGGSLMYIQEQTKEILDVRSSMDIDNGGQHENKKRA